MSWLQTWYAEFFCWLFGSSRPVLALKINVRLPIPFPAVDIPADERRRILAQQQSFLYMTQIKKYKTIAPGFLYVFQSTVCRKTSSASHTDPQRRLLSSHAGKWWVRLSAQIYNDMDDFRRVGAILKTICEQIRNGGYGPEVIEGIYGEDD